MAERQASAHHFEGTEVGKLPPGQTRPLGTEDPEGRERWSSRTAFILAAIGSAVGLGNVWRFPSLVFQYEGVVFLIPYFAALLLLGLPVLMLELSLGQQFQRGDIEAFGSINKRLRGVGLGSVMTGFLVVSYYSTILAYTVVYFVASFQDPPAYKADPEDFFYNTVLRLASDEQLQDAKSYIISGVIYAGLLATWLIVFFCLYKGVQGTSKVVGVTVPLPLLILLILLIYNLNREGAGDGIEAYLKPESLDILKEPAVWSAAAGQIFFSLSVSLGIMTAYGSYIDPTQDIVMDTQIVAISNSGISIFAGFVVYAMLGALAHETDQSIEEVGASAGLGLVFIAYPAGLSFMPDGVSNFMGVIFFLCLFTLGIDSAFSFLEGITTVIGDTPRFSHITKPTLVGVACMAAFVLSTLYATDLGLFLLDAVDHYLNTYGLLTIAALECIAVSWVWGYMETKEAIGGFATHAIYGGYFGGIAVGCSVAGALAEENVLAKDNVHLILGIVIGLALFVMGFLMGFATRCDKDLSFSEFFAVVSYTGTNYLRESINSKGKPGNHKLWKVWDLMIRYLDPVLLLGLLCSAAYSDAKTDGYEGYPDWLQAVGIVCIAILMTAVIATIIFPELWDKVTAKTGKEMDVAEETKNEPLGVKGSAIAGTTY